MTANCSATHRYRTVARAERQALPCACACAAPSGASQRREPRLSLTRFFPTRKASHMTEPTPQPAAQPAAPLTEAEDKQWASFAHFGGILGLAAGAHHLAGLQGPWRQDQRRGQGGPQLADHLLRSAGSRCSSSARSSRPRCSFTAPASDLDLHASLPWIWWILNVIFSILGGVKVNGGGSYRYPFALRLIK